LNQPWESIVTPYFSKIHPHWTVLSGIFP
jgi:hypothetical protein